MKILLINPPHWELTGINNRQNPGLGLLYLAAQLPEHKVTVLDAEAYRMDWGQLEAYIHGFKPDVVGVTATTLSFKAMVKTCKLTRSLFPDVKIVVGGPHVSAEPIKSKVLTGANDTIEGEGEIFFSALLGYYENADAPCKITTADLMPDLNVRLPRELHDPAITSNFYIGNDPVYVRPETAVMWERGCPHKCNFCSTHAVHGRVMRRRSPESIIAELTELKKAGVKSIFVYDDELIGVNREQHEWLLGVCETIIDRKLNDLIFKTQGRCDSILINSDLMEVMKEAGFKCLMMGCESGSQRVLDTIQKGITVEDIEYSIETIHKAGIETFCYWMVGNKGETVEDCQKTLELITELKPYTNHKHVTILNPLPGSEIYEEAMREGWILNPDFNAWTQHGNPIVQGPWMTAQEIIEWERKLIAA